jgi:hypothetical protein
MIIQERLVLSHFYPFMYYGLKSGDRPLLEIRQWDGCSYFGVSRKSWGDAALIAGSAGVFREKAIALLAASSGRVAKAQ